MSETKAVTGVSELDAMKAEIAKLRAENDKLSAKKGKAGKPTLKVANGGGVSVYGLARFPTTLYPEQMLTLLGMAEEIKAFIETNAKDLKARDESKDAYFARTGKSPLPAKGEVSDADETNGAAAGIAGSVKAGVSGMAVVRRVA